jgi:hypothetical protein
MAGNRKPTRKVKPAARPRVGLTPMMKPTHDNLATELHTAILTLREAPSVVAWNEVMKKVEAMTLATAFMRRKNLCVDRDPLANALRTMLYALNAAGERHDRIGVMKLSEAEGSSMKMAAAAMDGALAKIPVNVYRGSLRLAAQQQLVMHAQKMREQAKAVAA